MAYHVWELNQIHPLVKEQLNFVRTDTQTYGQEQIYMTPLIVGALKHPGTPNTDIAKGRQILYFC